MLISGIFFVLIKKGVIKHLNTTNTVKPSEVASKEEIKNINDEKNGCENNNNNENENGNGNNDNNEGKLNENKNENNENGKVKGDKTLFSETDEEKKLKSSENKA